jgi:hypothetical protein
MPCLVYIDGVEHVACPVVEAGGLDHFTEFVRAVRDPRLELPYDLSA